MIGEVYCANLRPLIAISHNKPHRTDISLTDSFFQKCRRPPWLNGPELNCGTGLVAELVNLQCEPFLMMNRVGISLFAKDPCKDQVAKVR